MLMERPPRCARTSAISTIMVLLVVGSVSSTMIFSYKQAAFAHVFTGDESASFMSVIKTLQAEANLVQTNLATNESCYKPDFGSKPCEGCCGCGKLKSYIRCSPK